MELIFLRSLLLWALAQCTSAIFRQVEFLHEIGPGRYVNYTVLDSLKHNQKQTKTTKILPLYTLETSIKNYNLLVSPNQSSEHYFLKEKLPLKMTNTFKTGIKQHKDSQNNGFSKVNLKAKYNHEKGLSDGENKYEENEYNDKNRDEEVDSDEENTIEEHEDNHDEENEENHDEEEHSDEENTNEEHEDSHDEENGENNDEEGNSDGENVNEEDEDHEENHDEELHSDGENINEEHEDNHNEENEETHDEEGHSDGENITEEHEDEGQNVNEEGHESYCEEHDETHGSERNAVENMTVNSSKHINKDKGFDMESINASIQL